MHCCQHLFVPSQTCHTLSTFPSPYPNGVGWPRAHQPRTAARGPPPSAVIRRGQLRAVGARWRRHPEGRRAARAQRGGHRSARVADGTDGRRRARPRGNKNGHRTPGRRARQPSFLLPRSLLWTAPSCACEPLAPAPLALPRRARPPRPFPRPRAVVRSTRGRWTRSARRSRAARAHRGGACSAARTRTRSPRAAGSTARSASCTRSRRVAAADAWATRRIDGPCLIARSQLAWRGASRRRHPRLA